MKVNKRVLTPVLFFYFANIFFAQNYIKAEVKSFQYEKEPISISNIYFNIFQSILNKLDKRANIFLSSLSF